jgi:hypothetical protein
MIRKYVRYQEEKEKQFEQLKLNLKVNHNAAQLGSPASSGGRAIAHPMGAPVKSTPIGPGLFTIASASDPVNPALFLA